MSVFSLIREIDILTNQTTYTGCITMKKIVAINASPRTTWNTATLVREAAKGAESKGAEAVIFDLDRKSVV